MEISIEKQSDNRDSTELFDNTYCYQYLNTCGSHEKDYNYNCGEKDDQNFPSTSVKIIPIASVELSTRTF